MSGTARPAVVSGIRPTTKERAALSKERHADAGAVRRRAVRIPLPEDFALVVRLDQGGGGATTNIRACARDLSSHGIGFFHGAFMHAGTECVFVMKALDGTALTVPGKITRCRHAHGRLHVVGAEFESPVDVARLVPDAERLLAEAGRDPTVAAEVAVQKLHVRVVELAGEIARLAEAGTGAASILTKVEDLTRLLADAVERSTPNAAEPHGGAPPPAGPPPRATAPDGAPAR